MIRLPEHSLLILTTGAVILGVELTASRYMSPMFGSSLYIWGAILSVTLVCLSIGYSFGGRLGERLDKPVGRLILFVLVSAAWIGVLPVIQGPVARLSLLAGQLFGPLVVTTLLFALPLLLLATATPLVFAEAARKRQDGHATTIGDLFAISTVGSVVGALVTAYGLIPALGLRNTLFVLAIALLVPALPYILRGIHIRTASSVVFLVAAAQLSYGAFFERSINPDYQLLHHESSRYGELSVLNNTRDGSRLLLLDGTSQNLVTGEALDESLFPYTAVVYGQLTQYPLSNKRALVLGLGAGTIPRHLREHGFEVDSVEIDPAVYRIAREYFAFPPDLPVYLEDARVFMQRAAREGQSYGVIILDVAGGGSQPSHIFNADAFALMSALLSEDGLLIVNQLSIMAPPHDRLVKHSLASLRQFFSEVRGFNCNPHEPEGTLINFVTVAANRLPESTRYRSHVQESLYTADVTGYRPLTDNWNPVDLWSVEVNRKWHRQIIDWIGYGALIPL